MFAGIGTKLLTKQGYVPGTGLGRKGEGLKEPIAALRFKHGSAKLYDVLAVCLLPT